MDGGTQVDENTQEEKTAAVQSGCGSDRASVRERERVEMETDYSIPESGQFVLFIMDHGCCVLSLPSGQQH